MSTRRSRSPRVISAAAVAIVSSGLSSRRITTLAVAPSRINSPAVISSSVRMRRETVWLTSASDTHATRYPGSCCWPWEISSARIR